MDDTKNQDAHPAKIDVYGWVILYKKDGQWVADQDDEYLNLPAHYLFPNEALDRVSWLRERGVECRVAALIREEHDTPEEFEKNKVT